MAEQRRLPFCATPGEVKAPAGWSVLRIVDAYEQLDIGRRYDKKMVHPQGRVPVLDQSTSGEIGFHDDAPGVLASRDRPVVTFANHTCAMRIVRSPFSVIQNVFPMVGRPGICDTEFLYYATNGRQQTEEYKGHHPAWRNSYFALPPLQVQERVSSVLLAFDNLIENNIRRIEILEEMAQAIYREWFVNFRFPGHEDVQLVDSELGPIPEGWLTKSVASVAGPGRNAVTGGPFGSSLGRKDYTDSGVPVLRGGNLRIGGGFDESDLVYVSDAKADALRSSLTVRGDIVVTQRGTLGQVGLIPMQSKAERYLLSQSQMKITVDPSMASTEFVYAQMRSPEATARFVARAMSSGVPHVNLALLRDFEIAYPPLHLQRHFADVVAPMSEFERLLAEQNRQLRAVRDLLLPRLISGEVDVSDLDIDVGELVT